VRYVVQREDGTLLDNCGKEFGFNSKVGAEAWIQEHLELLGGLDWRVGFYFKAKFDKSPFKIVWSKSRKEVRMV
jgi:hypothetical protein